MHRAIGRATVTTPLLRDLSVEAVARRAAAVRANDRTPCDVCGNAATMFMRCDADDFKSFLCYHDTVILSKQYFARGLDVMAERLVMTRPLTTDVSTSVAEIVNLIDADPFRFAIRFLNLERMVEQLNARLGGAH